MSYSRKKSYVGWVIAAAVVVAVVTFITAVDGWTFLSPAKTQTYGLESDTAIYDYITDTYPGATDLVVDQSSDNPDTVRWTLPNGTECSGVVNGIVRSVQPTRFITEPFCTGAVQ